jgi:hypothetical protein
MEATSEGNEAKERVPTISLFGTALLYQTMPVDKDNDKDPFPSPSSRHVNWIESVLAELRREARLKILEKSFGVRGPCSGPIHGGFPYAILMLCSLFDMAVAQLAARARLQESKDDLRTSFFGAGASSLFRSITKGESESVRAVRHVTPLLHVRRERRDKHDRDWRALWVDILERFRDRCVHREAMVVYERDFKDMRDCLGVGDQENDCDEIVFYKFYLRCCDGLDDLAIAVAQL